MIEIQEQNIEVEAQDKTGFQKGVIPLQSEQRR